MKKILLSWFRKFDQWIFPPVRITISLDAGIRLVDGEAVLYASATSDDFASGQAIRAEQILSPQERDQLMQLLLTVEARTQQ